MPLPFAEYRLSIPARVVSRAVGGATVLLDVESGRSFSLDEVGSKAWGALTSSPTIQHAYDALLTDFQADAVELQRDLERLIDQLNASGLVEMRRV